MHSGSYIQTKQAFSHWKNQNYKREVCRNKDVIVGPLCFIPSKNLYNDIQKVLNYVMNKSKMKKKNLTRLTTCLLLHKWQMNFTELTQDLIWPLSFSYPRLSSGACIHPRRGKEKVFRWQVSNVPELMQINRRCLHMCSIACGSLGGCTDRHTCMFLYVCACVFWAAGSTDWYVFPSVAVGWVWIPICFTQFMVL